LGLNEHESLSEERQMASVVMSVAAHTAFVHRLRERVQPGKLTPGDPKFNLKFIGHSVGEMGSFIEAGIMDIPTVAWLLNERQKITEDPVQTGMRFMLAGVGIHVDQLQTGLGQIREAFDGKVRATLANKNTPSQGVLSVEALEGDARSVARRLNELFAAYQHPTSERAPRFIPLPIKNAFHSIILGPEERLLQMIIDPRLNNRNFKAPEPGIIYSPMLPGWIRSRKQALHVVRHQLTSEVQFSRGVGDIMNIPNVVTFITADIKEEVTPKMVRDNIGDQMPIQNIKSINIKSIQSLEQAVDLTEQLIAA
jgi:hypothetical protein